jgi:hypothetical protein
LGVGPVPHRPSYLPARPVAGPFLPIKVRFVYNHQKIVFLLFQHWSITPMALPATHLRFAAVLADQLAVSDWQAYLSGTLYPDSRWVTGVARQQTHDARFRDPAFATDDFTLGWHIHCACDQIQGDIHAACLGDLTTLTPIARWVRVSAAKVIQDMDDAAKGKLSDYLPLLVACQTPNQESDADIDNYFGFVKQAYHRLSTPAWQDYARLWEQVGLDRPTVLQIENEVQQMRSDPSLIATLNAIFDQMVNQYSIIH